MVSIKELEKEVKRIDRHYARKWEYYLERGLGRSKEAKQIKKEWIEKAVKIEKEIKSRTINNRKR